MGGRASHEEEEAEEAYGEGSSDNGFETSGFDRGRAGGTWEKEKESSLTRSGPTGSSLSPKTASILSSLEGAHEEEQERKEPTEDEDNSEQEDNDEEDDDDEDAKKGEVERGGAEVAEISLAEGFGLKKFNNVAD